MKLKFHEAALADLREGRAFYRKRSPMAAVAFAHAIDDAINAILEAPARYAVGAYGSRELVLPRRFPYTIAYTVQDEVVIVLAIAHHSREAGYWRERS